MLPAFPGRIERIVLYGSRVRGEAHGESDWDFAVFFRGELSEAFREALWEIDW